jgi:hypothetical protein
MSLHIPRLVCNEEAEDVLIISCNARYFVWHRLYAGYRVTFTTDILLGERIFNISLENHTDNSLILEIWEMGARKSIDHFVFNRSLTPPDRVYDMFQSLFKKVTGLDPYVFS